MSHAELKKVYGRLWEAARAGDPLDQPWEDFADMVEAGRERPWLGIRPLLGPLRRVFGDRDPATIDILDHGCGGGMKALHLAALGYERVYGVNVNDDVTPINRILAEVFGVPEQRFYTTDGGALPFADGSMDFIMSCQVLEHVGADNIDMYYTEEGRVLRPGGAAYHQVPHRLVPFDGHSRLWFAHWAPRFARPAAYAVLKSLQQRRMLLHLGRHYADKFDGGFLSLRSPFFHRRRIARDIGPWEELTDERIGARWVIDEYDADVPRGPRALLGAVVRTPLVGPALLPLARNLVMIETLARKPAATDAGAGPAPAGQAEAARGAGPRTQD